MKRLTLVVKPFKVDAVARALVEAGAFALTFTEARGYGRQKGHLEQYRDESRRVNFLPKLRLECCIRDEDAEAAVASAVTAARTGRIGDGKIFVEDVQEGPGEPQGGLGRVGKGTPAAPPAPSPPGEGAPEDGP